MHIGNTVLGIHNTYVYYANWIWQKLVRPTVLQIEKSTTYSNIII